MMNKLLMLIAAAVTSLLLFGVTVTLFSATPGYAKGKLNEKAKFCRDFRIESGYNCQVERCPCGRNEKELKRWDRKGLKFSLCACVGAANYERYQDKLLEERNKNRCSTNADCSDGIFCNGEEICKTSDSVKVRNSSSDSERHGYCEQGEPPCEAGGVCFEREKSCKAPCEDKDGDGYKAMHCGGDDCDDNDASRSPGNEEVCESNGIDEDCDATTVGDLDLDGDGYISAQCR